MVHIPFKWPLAAILLAAPLAALATGPYPTTDFGVPFSTTEDWYRQCMRVEQIAPEPAAGKAPAGCDATGLYYRKRGQAETSQAEWDQVRACAAATSNSAVLMMLYANGYGVARDTDRAIHYACSLEYVAKAEMVGRVAHLASGEDRGKPFDQCDDITSGAMGGVCAELRETQARRVREARLERATHGLPAASRAAFARLRVAAENYARAGVDETDMQGTAAAQFATEHEAWRREEFMQAVLDAIDGKLAPASSAEFAERDRELNTLYQDLMAAPSRQPDEPDRIGDSTIRHADVRKAERTWLAYRDAFLAFGASLPSGADAAAISTVLTTERIDQLRKVERYR
jgi:uncharacterized protein YecT (DUF1311 family)